MSKVKKYSESSDFEQCLHNAKTVRERLDTLVRFLKKFITAMSDTTTAFEGVGACYIDMAAAATVMTDSEEKSASKRQVVDTRNALYNFAKIFTSKMREMKDGQVFTNCKSDIHKRILEPLQPLRNEAKKVVTAGKSRSVAYKKYQKAIAVVEKKRKKYDAKDKLISESKLYTKQVAQREKACGKFENANEHFTVLYNTLLENIEKATGQAMDSFVDISSCLLQYMLNTIQDVTQDLTKRYPVVDDIFVSAVRGDRAQHNHKQTPQDHSQSPQDHKGSAQDADASPLTASSEMKTLDVPSYQATANDIAVHVLNEDRELFGNTPDAVENPRPPVFMELHSDSEARVLDMEGEKQPSTTTRTLSARFQFREADADEPTTARV